MQIVTSSFPLYSCLVKLLICSSQIILIPYITICRSRRARLHEKIAAYVIYTTHYRLPIPIQRMLLGELHKKFLTFVVTMWSKGNKSSETFDAFYQNLAALLKLFLASDSIIVMEFHNRNIVNAKIESRIQTVTIELLYIRYIKFTQYMTVIKI